MNFLFKYHALSNHTRVITFFLTGTVVWVCSLKNVFLQISQNSQENICVGVFFYKIAGSSNLAYPKSGTQDPKVGLGTKDPKVGP